MQEGSLASSADSRVCLLMRDARAPVNLSAANVLPGSCCTANTHLKEAREDTASSLLQMVPHAAKSAPESADFSHMDTCFLEGIPVFVPTHCVPRSTNTPSPAPTLLHLGT